MIKAEDFRLLKAAQREATKSQDPSRKTGCVIASDGQALVWAHNAFPSGVAATAERMQRPAKYEFTEHAERNAIYIMARAGARTVGCTAYLTWYPCAPCARALVECGISRLVCYEPDWTEEQYGFQYARDILLEGGVIVEFAGRYSEQPR